MKRSAPILFLAVAVVCFWQAGRHQDTLLQQRRQFHLDLADPLENSPPLVAFTQVALGGFRGIMADLLWLRATRLQDEGKYFELVQLADWITKLQPRFALVWAYQAWNMAYNISVLFNDQADRWRWVRHGIELLRDEGLHYNPGEPNLYRELGWIYQHKIAGYSDQAHWYYKEQWAREMMTLFDGPRPDYAVYKAAARTPEELWKQPGLAELAGSLQKLGQDPLSEALLDAGRLPAAVQQLLQANPATRELQLYLRVRRMRETYKLDPALMEEADAKYGPLDWRLPQAHAIYWAWRGQSHAVDEDSKIALQRMVFQSMADAFYQGQLFYSAGENKMIPSPNLALLPKVRQAYEEAIKEHPDQEALKAAHRIFMETAVLVLYNYQRLAEARELFEDLNRRYPTPETSQGLESFVYRNFISFEHGVTEREIVGLIVGALTQSYVWLALGDDDRANGFQQMAQLAYRKYQAIHSDPASQERSGLPPFEDLARQAATQARQSLSTPEARAKLEKLFPPAEPPTK